jgi:hypothetical protein
MESIFDVIRLADGDSVESLLYRHQPPKTYHFYTSSGILRFWSEDEWQALRGRYVSGNPRGTIYTIDQTGSLIRSTGPDGWYSVFGKKESKHAGKLIRVLGSERLAFLTEN